MWPFKKPTIESLVNPKKKIKVNGVEFVIKKLDVLDHLQGSKVLQQSFDTYKLDKPGDQDVNVKKVKEHYVDVLCAGVVSPAIGRKPGDGVVYVQDMFNNWDLVNNLYSEIIAFTYGKKKQWLNSVAKD
jgi:hypothetical protein